eukprot:scaffold36934_cov61-Phaeocystis_antarctica.AAC.1
MSRHPQACKYRPSSEDGATATLPLTPPPRKPSLPRPAAAAYNSKDWPVYDRPALPKRLIGRGLWPELGAAGGMIWR